MGNYLLISFLLLVYGTISAQAQLFVSNQSLPSSCPAPDPTLNYRSVIGIVSHPGDGATGRLSNATNVSYIASSYVKFAEMAGARVIPLIYTEPPQVLNQLNWIIYQYSELGGKCLKKKFSLVNGVIFTGGWAKDGLYFDVIKGIFQKVLEKNDAGEHFPVLAICLGYELLTMIITNNNNILEEFSAASQASTVQFVENVNIEGTVFGRFPPALLKKMSIDCLVMQNHHQFGISPERFQANKELSSFFRVLTASTDENNKVYVSTVQARRYPIAAFQWNPE